MGVYNDMANDAGYRYGTDENRQLAANIEAEQYKQYRRCQEEKEMEKLFEEQSYYCEKCKYRIIKSHEDKWCYMFPEIILGCKQFKTAPKPGQAD